VAHSASYPMGTGGVKLTTAHHHLVPRLRMCGATPPFHQYVFIAWCLIKQEICLHGLMVS